MVVLVQWVGSFRLRGERQRAFVVLRFFQSGPFIREVWPDPQTISYSANQKVSFSIKTVAVVILIEGILGCRQAFPDEVVDLRGCLTEREAVRSGGLVDHVDGISQATEAAVPHP